MKEEYEKSLHFKIYNPQELITAKVKAKILFNEWLRTQKQYN